MARPAAQRNLAMPVIELAISIAAPVERVFDLARSIDLHMCSTSSTGERAIAGVTSGLIGLGEEVTWRAKHLGSWQSLSVRITEFERPTHFADVMQRGAFRRMEHHHYFEPTPGGTIMRDEFAYESPLGILGRIADILFLERYLRSFLIERNRVIKAAAQSDGWRQYVRDVPERFGTADDADSTDIGKS
jgi:ligand-binding SRPBCC domain-containing protein